MQQINHKYQEEYENTAGLFWGDKPAKYVKLFSESINSDLLNSTILDLGAGEGKNSVYMAGLGGIVTAVEISPIALSKFELHHNYQKYKSSIIKINNDILSVSFMDHNFDIVIAYGIFHCLSNKNQIEIMIEKVKKWIKPGGYFIGATFTDKISPPKNIQKYLEEESFLQEGVFEKLFENWKIINSENEIITETHPTSKIQHEHSICRLIAKKI